MGGMLLQLGLLRGAHGYISVTPEGNLTLYGATSVGAWESSETSDLYVTGGVVLGRVESDIDSGRIMMSGENATLLSTEGDISIVPADKFVLESSSGDSVAVLRLPLQLPKPGRGGPPQRG